MLKLMLYTTRSSFVSKGEALSHSMYVYVWMPLSSLPSSTTWVTETPSACLAWGYGPTWVRPPAVCGAGPGAPSWLGPRLDRTAEVPYVPTL